MRTVYYKRFENNRIHHFCPAPGYNCPRIPLGVSKRPDYEVVKVVATTGVDLLKNRRVLISWGLNIPRRQWAKVNQVIALENPAAEYGELVLAVAE